MNSFPSYLMIKSYYDKGYWDLNQVDKAVESNRITTNQYETITGSEYPNKHLSTAIEVDSKDIPDYMQSTSPVSGVEDGVTQAELNGGEHHDTETS